MNIPNCLKTIGILTAMIALTTASPLEAFPPAPPHVIYGMVRDEWGTKLTISDAVVTLETSAGVQADTKVLSVFDDTFSPPANYKLFISMDSGSTTDAYKTNALRPAAPFKLKVTIGNVAYLPLEMVANFRALGQPGQKTRVDLTLGEDLDGDGLPDAWERALLAALGRSGGIADIKPNGDDDLDGRSNLDEFLASTSPLDPEGYKIIDVKMVNGKPTFKFFAALGRNYSIQCVNDLSSTNWNGVSFKLPSESPDAVTNFQAGEYKLLSVEITSPLPENGLFRLKVQ